MDAARLELLGLHEAGWWALVEHFEAALGLAALALGGFSLLALALALVEWTNGRRAAHASAVITPARMASISTSSATVGPGTTARGHAAAVATPVPARRRTRVLVRHLASRVVCPIHAASGQGYGSLSPAALPVRVIARSGRS